MCDFRNLIIRNKLDVHLKTGDVVRKDMEMYKIQVDQKLILQPNVNGMNRLNEEDLYKK